MIQDGSPLIRDATGTDDWVSEDVHRDLTAQVVRNLRRRVYGLHLLENLLQNSVLPLVALAYSQQVLTGLVLAQFHELLEDFEYVVNGIEGGWPAGFSL